jgi:hypothetical protein
MLKFKNSQESLKSYVDSTGQYVVFATFMKDIEPIKWLRLKKDFKKKSIKYFEKKDTMLP